MTEITLLSTKVGRRVAAEPSVPLVNMFVEGNPILNETGVSFIARPGMKKWQEVGSGPVRGLFDEPGVFSGDLFVVSGEGLYRIDASDGTPEYIDDIGVGTGDVSFAATAPIGIIPAHLFIAEGGVLWLYTEAGGLSQVAMPDDVGAISVAHINSYVIVVPVQTEALDTVGKFYWIEPGETTVDPLNFATAERAPDEIHQVKVFGNLFWLLGQKSVEPWQTTGNPVAPMQKYPGILFDRGSFEGSAVQVKSSLFIVDEDGGVFRIEDGIKRVSTPAVEELIRRAIQLQASSGN